jgi:antitoxin ParD1/3/4
MNITIHPHFQKFIDEQIKAGNYSTADAVINSALGQLEATVEFPPEELEELRREIEIGIEQADRGEFVAFTAEDVIREGREILAQKQKAV